MKFSLVEATYYFVELLYNQAFFCVSLQNEKKCILNRYKIIKNNTANQNEQI